MGVLRSRTFPFGQRRVSPPCTLDILGQVILCCGGSLVQCQSPWSLPSGCQEPPPPSWDNHKCLQTLPNAPWGAKLPLWRTTEIIGKVLLGA